MFSALLIALLGCLLGTSLLRVREFQPVKSKPNDSQPVISQNLSDKTKAGIMETITRREYDITDRQGILQSPNRKQRLRAVYKPGILTIEERISNTDFFQLNIKNKGIYADKKLLYQPELDFEIDKNENHLVIRHDGFSEEYINNESGIRQNFIIQKAPQNTRTITVSLEASGFDITDSGNNTLSFTKKRNKESDPVILTYDDLKCWDADGKVLAASLHGKGSEMRIDVEVSNAKFPVTIDPIIANGTPTNANKKMEINQYYAWFGYSVASAGDVNGDGYSDVLVGAPKYDNGEAEEGAAFLFPGSAEGVTLSATLLQGNQASAEAGTSVSSAGDINGDGYSDVLVGAPYYGPTDAGAAFVYFGSSSGINTVPDDTLIGTQASANFGISVATAGDVNGDGFSDFLVGAHQHDNGQTNEGAAFLYYGAASGYGTPTPVMLEANKVNAMMGYAVAPAGDIDGDGYSDVLCGARLYSNGQGYEGAVYIFKGSAAGIVTANPQHIESNQADARMGHSIATAGDVNGDGYSDVIIGAYLYDNGQKNEGAAMIYHGSSAGLNPTPALTLEGNQTEAWFGWAVAAAGDVNGDGYADVIVGGRYFENGQANEGSAFVYHGSASGLKPTPASTIESNQGNAWLGSAVASAGDVNGDGYSDIIIGAYTYDSGQTDEGLAMVYHGSASAIEPTPGTTTNGTTYSELSTSMSYAGDLNGDGIDDVIAGAPTHDPTMNLGLVFVYYGTLDGLDTPSATILYTEDEYYAYGESVSGAGDVNGDGYDDIIVGAYSYFATGKAFVYYGSATGISQSSKTELSYTSGSFGHRVAGVGDLNGDGFADVAVNVPQYTEDEAIRGAVMVYFGSAAGIGTTPKIYVGQEDPYSFSRISGAGDVNGDHYDDLMIADFEPGGTEAKVMVYHGSATGPGDTPAVTLASGISGAVIDAIAKGGDVNGDGFGDILIEAKVSGGGKALVYYGSSTGLSAVNRTVISKNNVGFASALGAAGDVNGDGYGDVVIGNGGYILPGGQFPSGAAYVYLGSPAGISTTEVIAITDSAPDWLMGHTVSGAGDVNGDGYSDVLVGVKHYADAYNGSQGQVRVYHGNNGKNLRNDARLYNADLTSYYNQNYPGQNTETNFGIGLFVKSFLGTNKGKLVWETRSPGNAFSQTGSAPITNSTQYTGAQNAYVSLAATGTELKNLIAKASPATNVRVRVKYDPVLALTGQQYGPWRYLPDYLLGNAIAPPPQPETSVLRRSTIANREFGPALVVYPNPVTDKIIIRNQNATAIQSLELISPDGKSIRKTPAGQQDMNVKDLPSGTYLLIINQKSKTSTHKVLIR